MADPEAAILWRMGDPDKIARDDWETLLHAPFRVYSLVAGAEGAEPTVAQFRALTEALTAATGRFEGGTIGHVLAATLVADLDPLWTSYGASHRSPKDGLKHVKRALRSAPDDEAIEISDWLVDLAVTIARSSRTMGEAALSAQEATAVREIAGWLDRPTPADAAD